MKLVFHVGLHKTASTTMQHHVFPQLFGDRFHEDHTCAATRQAMALIFSPGLFDAENAGECLKRAVKGNTDRPHLFSCELLSGNPYITAPTAREYATRLSELPCDACQVVVVVREQRAIIESLYRQYVAIGGTLPPDAFYRFKPSVSLQGLDPTYFCFDRLVRMYDQLFGRDNVTVCMFEPFIQHDPKWALPLKTAMGDTEQTPSNPFVLPVQNSHQNPAFTYRNTCILRFVNRFTSHYFLQKAAISRRLADTQTVAGLLRKHNRKPAGERMFTGHLYKRYPQLIEIIRQSNQRLLALRPQLELKTYGYAMAA